MSVLIGMVGDLLIDRDKPDEAFLEVDKLLSAVDVRFGNLEANFTDDPHMAPSGGVPLFPARSNLDVFPRAGFNVLSMANNHIVDAGHAAMLENRAALRAAGVATCGCGETLADARRPAIVEACGMRIAFLAYASVFPMGYEARSNVPGLAPFRAYDLWRPMIPNYHAPGTPPIASTVPDEGDLAAVADDIARAKRDADLVITSFHWGDFLRPFHLTDHEIRSARWAIDQGADMVIGHHHHALRGAEWYKGKPVFYGLGHFVFDLKLDLSDEIRRMMNTAPAEAHSYAIFPREGWPLLPLHPDTRMTCFAYAEADESGVLEIGLVPCRLRPDGRVFPVDPRTQEGAEVIDYMQKCIDLPKLNAAMEPTVRQVGGHQAVKITSITGMA